MVGKRILGVFLLFSFGPYLRGRHEIRDSLYRYTEIPMTNQIAVADLVDCLPLL